MAFTNTVETVGDAALMRSIIDKSIAELNCNITTSIRQYAFRACAALEKVNFPSCTSVALGAFWGCTALTRAEFESAVSFANNAFYGCTALTAVILRNTEAVSTIAGTPFAGSAIASGTGYIYVPQALVDTYKANWSAYAEQIRAIEEYVGIADLYSWAGVAANIADGSYASVYKVGDLVELDLGSEGVVNMEIAAFDTDDLADGSGKAPISWVSKELLTTIKRMNPSRESTTDDSGATVYTEGTGSIGGWEKTEIRTYVQNDIKALIPEDVLALIKTVTKQSVGYNTAGTKTQYETTDDIWIPSYREVFGGTSYETTGAVYSGLFKDSASRVKKKYNASSVIYWWLRSANGGASFGYVSAVGSHNNSSASGTNGVALGFCT